MSILSVNVSLPKVVEYRGGRVETGIFKDPVAGSVMKRELNLDGVGRRGNLDRAEAALRMGALPLGWRDEFEDRPRRAGVFVGAEAALDDCCGPSA